MANYHKVDDIELIAHVYGGKYYKLANVVTSISWSGDIKSPSRMLEFEFVQSVTDKKIKNIGINSNTTMCFFVGGKEIFRGTVVDIDKTNTNNSIRVTAFDIGHYLTKDETNFNFKDTTACDIAKAVFKGKDGQEPLKYGKIAVAGTKITKMFIGTTRYETIMSAYTEHSKKDKAHKKYMIEVDIDKFNVVEKGVTKLKLMFEEEKNIQSASFKQSADDIVSRVLVVDELGNKIKVKIDKELKKIYKFYTTKVIEQKKDKAVSDDEINEAFKGLDKRCSLVGYGDITCKAGYKVQVKDNATGLVGEFYIDKDKHTWIGGKYDISLELNFENIMDEKSAGKDEPKEEPKESVGGTYSAEGGWTGGNLVRKGEWGPATLSQEIINAIIVQSRKYSIIPSFIITQLWAESSWGTSPVGVKNNNWAGVTWPYKGDPSIKKYKGTPRPSSEGDNYVKWNSVSDFIIDHFYLFRSGGYYKVQKKTSIDTFINGLLRPEAQHNYAASSNYRSFMKSVNRGLMKDFGDKLNAIDRLVYENRDWKTGVIVSPQISGTSSGGGYIEKAIAYALSRQGRSYSSEGQTWDTYAQLNNRGRSNPKYTRNSYLYHSPENARTFDCSSLCYYAYVNAGFLKKVGGNAMTTVSLSSNPGAYKMKKVPLSQAKRGDILWRSGHVALYLGGGATVEANSPSQGINRWPNNLRLFNTAYRPIL